jgi:hypothetical protein
MYLREVREMQAKARGIAYGKKKRKRPPPGSSDHHALSVGAVNASDMQVEMPGAH